MVVATCQCGQGCFAIGKVGEQFRMCWFRSSVCPRRNNPRTKPGCLRYQSSHAGYRFGRSGSSGFTGGFRRLRLSSCVPAPRSRSCLDWCRYRYICRPGGLPARGGCRPKRSGFGFRGRSCLNHAGMTFLKLLHFSDNLDVSLDIYPNCGLTR